MYVDTQRVLRSCQTHSLTYAFSKAQSLQEDRHWPSVVLERGGGGDREDGVQGLGGQAGEGQVCSQRRGPRASLLRPVSPPFLLHPIHSYTAVCEEVTLYQAFFSAPTTGMMSS